MSKRKRNGPREDSFGESIEASSFDFLVGAYVLSIIKVMIGHQPSFRLSRRFLGL